MMAMLMTEHILTTRLYMCMVMIVRVDMWFDNNADEVDASYGTVSHTMGCHTLSKMQCEATLLVTQSVATTLLPHGL